MRLIRPVFVALLSASMLLTACGGGSSITEADDPATTATTVATADPYAVPAIIDAAYVEKVLAGLDQIRATVRQNVYDKKTFDANDQARIRAIYIGDALVDQMKVWQIATTSPSPGTKLTGLVPASTTVSSLEVAKSDCVVAHISIDDTVNRENNVATISSFDYVLVPNALGTDINRTGWVIKYIDKAGSDAGSVNCD